MSALRYAQSDSNRQCMVFQSTCSMGLPSFRSHAGCKLLDVMLKSARVVS